MRVHLGLLAASVLGLAALAPSNAMADPYCRGPYHGRGCGGYVMVAPYAYAPAPIYYAPPVVYAPAPVYAPAYAYAPVPVYGAGVAVSRPVVSLGINIPLH